MPEEPTETLTWIADVPLITNPVVLRAMGFALGIAYLLVAIVFAVMMAVGERLDRLPAFLAVMLVASVLQPC